MTKPPKPPKPAGLPRNVRAVWSERWNRWAFRAVMDIDHRRVVGPRRLHVDDAVDDAATIRSARHLPAGSADTLEKAAEAVLRDAEARGVGERTLTASYRSHLRILLRYWRPETPVAAITEAEIEWFVREALADGRKPQTVRGKDLPMLQRVFAIAGVEDRVPAVRSRLQLRLRTQPPTRDAFTPEEFGDVIDRIRTAPLLAGRGHPRDRDEIEDHASVIELLAFTGIRFLELSRVAINDVDIESATLHVRKAKNIEEPREAALVGPSLQATRRLLERARQSRRPAGSSTSLVEEQFVRRVLDYWKRRLEEPRLTARNLRRSFLTWCDAAGASPREVMRLAGHQSVKTTSIYLQAGRIRAAEIIGAVIDRTGQHRPPTSGLQP